MSRVSLGRGAGQGARRLAALLAASLLSAGAAEAARTVNAFTLPTCPLTSAPPTGNDTLVIPVRVTTTNSDDWESTKFIWTDGAGNTFTNCINQSTNFTNSGIHDLSVDFIEAFDPGSGDDDFGIIAPAPTGPAGGYVSLGVQAYDGNSCTASGPSPIFTQTFGSPCQVDVPNADLAPGCGQDIILILDESGSIGSRNRNDVIQGARALVNAVKATGSRIALVEFSASDSRFVDLPNFAPGTYVEVTDTTIANDFNVYLTTGSSPTGSPTDTTTYSPGGNTPWDEALIDAKAIHTGAPLNRGPADLVVLLTDGNPTTNDCSLPGIEGDEQNLQCAVQAANDLKDETPAPHMFVVAVGGNINVPNIQMISGLDEFKSGNTAPQLLKADFTQVPFSQLEALFRGIAFALCAPSVTVTKKVDPDGPDFPDVPAPAQDTPFTGTVTVTTASDPKYDGTDDYQWVDPQPATACPTPETGKGCPGSGLAGLVGQTQTGWTDVDGTLNFGWIPNTQADPQPWASTLVLSEGVVSPLFFRQMRCERNRLNITTGIVTQTVFTCLRQRDVPLLPDGTPVPGNCVNGPTSGPSPVDECGDPQVVCGDLDVDTKTTIQLGAGDIMTCEVINDDISRLPVTLNYVRARQAGGEIAFEWETASESELLGFRLWAVVDGRWERIGEPLILAGGTESGAPQGYSASASTGALAGQPSAFGISSVDIDGSEIFFGPMRSGAPYGERVEVEPIDWEGIRVAVEERMDEIGYRKGKGRGQTWLRSGLREQRSKRLRSGRGETQLSAPEAGAAPLALSVTAASEPSVYSLLVEQSGMYRVTYEQLLAAGLDLAGVPAGDIAVTSRGQKHARQVSAKGGVFGPGSWIAFYGEALALPESLYTRQNVYQLQVERTLTKGTVAFALAPPAAEPFYQARAERNEQLSYSSTSPTGDPWYEAYGVGLPGSPTDIELKVTADHLVTDQPAILELGLWGITSFVGEAPDHQVRVFVNGNFVAQETADGLVSWPLAIPLASGALVEGENAVTVRITGEAGYDWDGVALDRLALVYPRAFVANGSLQFFADAPGFKVTNLTSKSMYAYAWQNGKLTRITQLVKTEDGGTWSAAFAGLSDEATYWVGPLGAMRTPEIAPAVPVADDLMAPADLLIIAHPFFKERLLNPGAKPDFVAAKEAQGYTVAVKDLFEIYQAFGHGLPLPEAIHAYLKAMSQKGFKHALLVGGSTRDPLNHDPRAASVDFIPTWYRFTGQTIYFTPTDVPYGDFQGDIVPERMVARWPVRTDEELDLIVQKSLDWYRGGLASEPSALLIADQKDPAYPPFGAQMDRAAKWLGVPDAVGNPTEWKDTAKVYLDPYLAESKTVADARADLIARINAGVAMTMMAGHGAYGSWTNNGLLSYQHVASMTNAGMPTLVTPLSCYTTYFVSDSTDTLGHHLLFDGDRGAVAIHGATVVSSVVQNEVIAEKIVKNLVHGGMDLGEAILKAKQELNPGHDTVTSWQLNGDPTLRLTVPQP